MGVSDAAEIIRAGLVITPHDASRHPAAYLTLVPVLGGFEPGGPDDVPLTRDTEDWLDYLRPDLVGSGDRVKVAVALLAETFYVDKSALMPLDSANVLCISKDAMERVEDALLARLRRDTPPAGEERIASEEDSEKDVDGIADDSETTIPASS